MRLPVVFVGLMGLGIMSSAFALDDSCDKSSGLKKQEVTVDWTSDSMSVSALFYEKLREMHADKSLRNQNEFVSVVEGANRSDLILKATNGTLTGSYSSSQGFLQVLRHKTSFSFTDLSATTDAASLQAVLFDFLMEIDALGRKDVEGQPLVKKDDREGFLTLEDDSISVSCRSKKAPGMIQVQQFECRIASKKS